MRLQMITITKVLPALLVLAMVASTQAQTSQPASRFRFVPTPRKQAAPEPGQIKHIASLMPVEDPSTAPGQLNPTVEPSAFQLQTGIETPAQPDNQTSSYYHAAPSDNSTRAQGFLIDSPPQTVDYEPQQIYLPPSQSAYNEPCLPMNRNFFGVDKDASCDEWDGFIPCGGLKAYPGHYGQPFIVGCDPCEPPCGRCSKCLIEKHRCKHGKSGFCTGCRAHNKAGPCGYSKCEKSCSAGCDTCAAATKSSSEGHSSAKSWATDTSDSSSRIGGLFGKLQSR